MKNLTLKQKLAGIALLLGVIALFAGNPYKGNHFSIDSKEMELILSKGADLVKPEELADWTIQGKSDFNVVDVRSEKDYQQYHIPNSVNVPIAGLNKAGLSKTEKILLVCTDGTISAQAWTFLKAKGYKGVYILKGGLNEWNSKILFPSLPENATPEQTAAFEKTKEVSKYFGGTPTIGGKTETKEAPKVQAPKLETPSGTNTQSSEPKKKKEGC